MSCSPETQGTIALQEVRAREVLRVCCHQRNHPVEPQHPPLGTTLAVSPRSQGTGHCKAQGHSNPSPSQLGSDQRQPGLAPTTSVSAIKIALKGPQPAPPLPFSPPGKAQKPPCETARSLLAVPQRLNINPQIRGGQFSFQVVML